MPDVAHSVTHEHFGGNSTRYDWLVFLKGRHTPVSIEHNMRSGQVVLDVCGKPEKSWSVKSFADVVEHPYNFTHEGHKFTLCKRTEKESEDSNKFELVIDGIPFKKHPYIS